jgi:hydroxymethylpyrimidine/phosphomethylpyrimidine kinase
VTPPRVLIIAGSDSSGGAGIQADIKTAQAFGCYAQTAITAVTAQDTRRVRVIHFIPVDIVVAQIEMCLDDIGADAIKIGMLGSAALIKAVAGALPKRIPIVLDPVIASTSGKRFLDKAAIEALKKHLVPRAAVITPNLPEARMLGDLSAAQAVLTKGGHATKATVDDVLVWKGGIETYAYPRVHTRHTHGTGCTLSTAIACGLAKGDSLPLAVGRAREYVQKALETAPGLGKGHGPLNHSV